MSIDINKPLTILSNEVAEIEKDENNEDLIVPITINDRKWATVSQYVYTNLLNPRYERAYDPLSRQVGYYQAYVQLDIKNKLECAKRYLRDGYETLIYSNETLANKLMETAGSNIVFKENMSAFLPDSVNIVGDVLMDIRKYLIQKTIIRKEQEKEDEMVPILYNTFCAYLYMKELILEKSSDVLDLIDKTPEQILASASDSFIKPRYDIIKKVYTQISIPSEIIEEIKNDPKSIYNYMYYLSQRVEPSVLMNIQNYTQDSQKTIEEYLCEPIPLDVIKVFSSNTKNIAALARKHFLRRGFVGIEANKNKKKILALAENAVAQKGYTEAKRRKLVDVLINRLSADDDILQSMKRTTNPTITDLFKEIDDKENNITLDSVVEAEKFTLDYDFKLTQNKEPEETILSKVLKEARRNVGATKIEKVMEDIEVSSSSIFSPFYQSDLMIRKNLFPSIAHYLIYRFVGDLPNVSSDELVTFYNSVIMCNKKDSTFISFERLVQIYNELKNTMNNYAKEFYLEKALNTKFFSLLNMASIEVNDVPKAISELAQTGNLRITSSETEDPVMTNYTVRWLIKNRNAIVEQLNNTKSETFDVNKIIQYSSLSTWVISNIKDFMNAVNRMFRFLEGNDFMVQKRPVNETIDFVKLFAYLVYYNDISIISLEQTELKDIEVPARVKYMFNGKYEHLIPAMDFIYKVVISPIYVLGTKLGMTVFDIDKVINYSVTDISNKNIKCLPSTIDQKVYNEKIKNKHKCILTSIIDTLSNLKEMMNNYNIQFKLNPEEIRLAVSIIYNININIKLQEPDDKEVEEILTRLLSTVGDVEEKSVSALYGAILSIDEVKMNPAVKINRSVYFTSSMYHTQKS
jgi:hypothetical protein